MLCSTSSDLTQVSHGENLRVLGDFMHLLADGRRNASGYTGIDLIKNDRIDLLKIVEDDFETQHQTGQLPS
mgnify:CR=1 FL=1